MNCVSFIDLLTVTRTLKASAEMNAVYFQRQFSDILPAAGGLPGLANFMYGSYTGIAMTMFMLIPSFAGMTEKTSAPEIAAVLGLTPSAVRMRLVRSREAIKNELCRGGFVYE